MQPGPRFAGCLLDAQVQGRTCDELCAEREEPCGENECTNDSTFHFTDDESEGRCEPWHNEAWVGGGCSDPIEFPPGMSAVECCCVGVGS